MLPQYFLLNFFKFLVCFSPIFALLVNRVKLDGKYFVGSEFLFGILTIFLFLDGLHWYPSLDLTVYMIFLMLNLAIFTYKFGVQNVNRALAVSILLTFIITEAWEFAVVVYAYFGLFGNTMLPIVHPLTHIYVVLCFYLATKISGFHLTKGSGSVLLFALLSSFLFFPPLDIIPVKIGEYNEQFNLLRIITFLSFVSAFYFWSGEKE